MKKIYFYIGLFISLIGSIITFISYNANSYSTIMVSSLEFTHQTTDIPSPLSIPIFCGIGMLSLGMTILLYYFILEIDNK